MRLMGAWRVGDVLVFSLVALLALFQVALGGNLPVLVALYAAAVGALAIGYGLVLWTRGESFPVPPRALAVEGILWISMLGFVFIQGLWPTDASEDGSRAWSAARGATWITCIHLVGLGLMYFLAAQATLRTGRGNLMLVSIVIISTALAIYALLALTQFGDTILGVPKWAYPGVATGTFVNRNSLATVLALGLAVVGALLVGQAADGTDAAMWQRRVLLCIAAVVMAAALLATASRTGLIAAAVGVLIAIVLSRARPLAILALSLGGLLLMGFLLAPLYGEQFVDRLAQLDLTQDDRWLLYNQILEMILDKPLLGHGAGAFEYAFPHYHHLPLSSDLVWSKAHSVYLSSLAELGVVFAPVAYLAVIATCVRLVRVARSNVSNLPRIVGCISAIAAVAVHSVFDFGLEIPSIAYLFAAILGTGAAGAAYPALLPRNTNE